MIWMIFALVAIGILTLGIFWFRADSPDDLPTAESRHACHRCDHRDCECEVAAPDKKAG
jgi:hypothetical protein